MYVLLTATVRPATDRVVHSDPRARLTEYVHALRWWSSFDPELIRGIVWVDNSGWGDLAEVEDAARHSPIPVEVIRVPARQPPPGIHYGYSELAMIRDAIKQSQLLSGWDGPIVKATGRLTFSNVPKLLEKLPTGVEFAGDSRKNFRNGRASIPFTETQLLVFTSAFFEDVLVDGLNWMSAERGMTNLENSVYHAVRPIQSSTVLMRFPVNVPPLGVGGDGRDYRSWRNRVRWCVRAVARRVVPALWL